jgi:hypothetical protein
VTIHRDATPPGITCLPTPSSLWPPTGRLVPVTVGVNVTDRDLAGKPTGCVATVAVPHYQGS